MLGLDSVDSVAHVIQIALTPVFLLSGIASLLGVLSTRLARVADRVDALAEQLEADGPIDRRKLRRRLAYLSACESQGLLRSVHSQDVSSSARGRGSSLSQTRA